MKTTLLVEKNNQLQLFFSINLLTWVGSGIKCFQNAKSALEFLAANPGSIDLIISRHQIDQEETAQILALSKDKLPMIVIGDKKRTVLEVKHIPSALDIKTLIKSCADALGVTAKAMANLSVPDFFPIPIQFFHSLKCSITGVYQEISQGNYQMLYQQFIEFTPEDITQLSAAGHQFLFVKKEDRLKFVTNLTQEIISETSIKDFNQDERFSAMEMSQKLLQQKIMRIGITPETVKLAQENLKNMIATSRKTPALLRLLKNLLNNKTGYLYKHTQVLMLIATHLMQDMDWGTPEQLDKLQFISYFHDIALENDEQAQIHSEAELKASGLSKEKKDIVNKHAQVAATLVSKYPRAPMGSELIIKQHHGVTHGMGFSESFTANLSPMAIVFILAEDFTGEVLKKGIEFDIEKKISLMREKYKTQRFQKIIDTLERITLT